MNTYSVKWHVLGTIVRPPYSGKKIVKAQSTDDAVASVKVRVASEMLFNARDVHIKSVIVTKEQVS